MKPEFTNVTDPRFVAWAKSPASGGSDGCLYVSAAADESGDVALAESTDGPTGSILVLDRASWAAFLEGAKEGAFDTV